MTIPQLSRRTSVRRPSIQTLARHGPRLANEVRRYLDVPRPYREVEELESELLAMWKPVLAGWSDEVSELEECCLFFSHLGFLHKYKVYGVKIALPFGYSLFDLADGAGFSFQVHEQPKLEGFHVLRTKNSSLLFICDRDEWEAEGRSWAVRRFGDGDCGVLPAGALVPLEGDVAAVSETNIVHTVLGCVLEEYASCSVDSVVRLHDQNDRSDPVLPKRHPSTAALVASGSTGLPRRHLSRDRTGWATRIPTSSGEILSTPRANGWRALIDPATPFVVGPGPEVTSVVVVSGWLQASTPHTMFVREPGDVVIIPPGLRVTLRAETLTTVSVHSVPAQVATYEWAR